MTILLDVRVSVVYTFTYGGKTMAGNEYDMGMETWSRSASPGVSFRRVCGMTVAAVTHGEGGWHWTVVANSGERSGSKEPHPDEATAQAAADVFLTRNGEPPR